MLLDDFIEYNPELINELDQIHKLHREELFSALYSLKTKYPENKLSDMLSYISLTPKNLILEYIQSKQIVYEYLLMILEVLAELDNVYNIYITLLKALLNNFIINKCILLDTKIDARTRDNLEISQSNILEIWRLIASHFDPDIFVNTSDHTTSPIHMPVSDNECYLISLAHDQIKHIKKNVYFPGLVKYNSMITFINAEIQETFYRVYRDVVRENQTKSSRK